MGDCHNALFLSPQYRPYVWGGQRLRPGERTAEAWIVHESNLIANGPMAGRTLSDAAVQMGEDLLGRGAVARTGLRFPLLIKLLDCAAWLSLQVHPDNTKAVRLEGPGNFGKTEAWHILDAAPGAELLGGLLPGMDAAGLEQAIRDGTLVEKMQRLVVHSGDSLLIPAGMIHALGPGLLVYEVQQVSDITYRVFDWNRPASEGRALHIEKSIAAADPAAVGVLVPRRDLADGERRQLVTCEFFTLDLLSASRQTIELDTAGKSATSAAGKSATSAGVESFHALTVFEGQAVLESDNWQQRLSRFETVLVPAACRTYRLRPLGPMKALLARAG